MGGQAGWVGVGRQIGVGGGGCGGHVGGARRQRKESQMGAGGGDRKGGEGGRWEERQMGERWGRLGEEHLERALTAVWLQPGTHRRRADSPVAG